MFYRRALRPLLFSFDAEFAHERALQVLAVSANLPFAASDRPFTHALLKTKIAGIEFPNPIGLAAGCDKNALAIRMWPRFAFGFVETGTVTAQPQPGNPTPRIFRMPQQKAIINRLGFNSDGAAIVAGRLAAMRRGRPLPVPLGINIGKTKLVTGDEATLEDYRSSFRRLAPLSDFMVVNVSSPNTPGLRLWQEKAKLNSLLSMLIGEANATGERRLVTAGTGAESAGDNVRKGSVDQAGRTGASTALQQAVSESQAAVKPVFVKISPDMAESELDDVLEVALEVGISGIIATNTTIERPGLGSSAVESGGLSGRPLRVRANEVMRYLYSRTGGRLPLIGVGGIFTAEDAYERLRSGASLLQLYTGLIYEGPYLPRSINAGLLKLMARDGVKSVGELVGTGASLS